MKQNFDHARELSERSSKDWKFGAASLPSLVVIPEKEREAYLPVGELQFDSKTDFSDCASRSPVNHLEALFTYHYAHAMKPENKLWLEENGYVNPLTKKVTFSDRFIAILSGTTHAGNSLKAPVDAINRCGLVPKTLLPKLDTMSWDEYYDKTAITLALLQLGRDFKARFTINYEQVTVKDFDVVSDMLGLAGYAWAAPDPVTGVYPAVPVSAGFNHAFLYYGDPKYIIFDNYYDNGKPTFIKTLAPNYNFFEYGYRVFLSTEVVPGHLFLEDLSYQIRDAEVTYLQKALVSLSYQIPNAVTAYYGTETRSAVMSFQRDSGIEDDGTHFGPRTRNALNKKMNPGQIFGGSFFTALAALFSGV